MLPYCPLKRYLNYIIFIRVTIKQFKINQEQVNELNERIETLQKKIGKRIETVIPPASSSPHLTLFDFLW